MIKNNQMNYVSLSLSVCCARASWSRSGITARLIPRAFTGHSNQSDSRSERSCASLVQSRLTPLSFLPKRPLFMTHLVLKKSVHYSVLLRARSLSQLHPEIHYMFKKKKIFEWFWCLFIWFGDVFPLLQSDVTPWRDRLIIKCCCIALLI